MKIAVFVPYYFDMLYCSHAVIQETNETYCGVDYHRDGFWLDNSHRNDIKFADENELNLREVECKRCLKILAGKEKK